MKKKIEFFMEKLIPKFLVWAFSFCWLMVVFKTFNIGFMCDLSWFTIFIPIFMFILTTLSYMIITFFYNTFIVVRHIPLTHKQKRNVHRKVKLAQEDTLIKKTLRKIIFFVASVLIAYLILL